MRVSSVLAVTSDEYSKLRRDAVLEEGRMFYERVRQTAHDTKIVNTMNQDSVFEVFQRLMSNCFNHQELYDFRPLSDRVKLDPTNIDHCAKHFHSGPYFVPVRIVRGANHLGSEISPEAFLVSLLSRANVRSKNAVTMLVAGIGEGKTTFVSNLFFKNFEAIRKRNFVPVRVNLDVATAHRNPTQLDLFSTLGRSIVAACMAAEIIEPNHGNLILASRFQNESTAQNDFCQIVEIIQISYKTNLLINIDNIDYLFHLFDRGSFSREAHSEYLRALQRLTDIVRLFLDPGAPIGRLGIAILFCVRFDTEAFIRANSNEVPNYGNNCETYSLLPSLKRRAAEGYQPPETEHREHIREQASEVVERRFELLEGLLGHLGDRSVEGVPLETLRKRLLDASQRYRKSGNTQSQLVEDMWRLGRRGIRDICDQIAQYSFVSARISDDDGVLLDDSIAARFWGHYSPPILTYCLGGNLLYAQFVGGMHNIFLVNPTTPQADDGVPDEMREPEFTSFWLKFFILRLIAKNNGERVDPNRVVDIFCGRNRRGYAEPLVRLALGSLSQLPQSDCVDVVIGTDGGGGSAPYIRRLQPTSRGAYLVSESEPFSFRFTYLQLALDDHRLRFPRQLDKMFAYQSDLDYRYLVADAPQYSAANARMLEAKSIATLDFSILLEEYLKVEMALYPNVFSRLTQFGIAIPSEGEIVNTVLNDLSRITARTKKPNMEYRRIAKEDYLVARRSEIGGTLIGINKIHRAFLDKVYKLN